MGRDRSIRLREREEAPRGQQVRPRVEAGRADGAGRRVRGVAGRRVPRDVTDQESFNNVKQWLHEIDRYACANVKKLLVGNKCDLASKRAVPTEQAAEFAESLGVEYLETSAKSALNVEKAFTTMASEIRKWMQSQPAPAAQTKVNIGKGRPSARRA